MKVRADREVCIGAGQCALRAPDVFDQDEAEGRVLLLQPEPEAAHRKAVLEAVRLCPSGAITAEAVEVE